MADGEIVIKATIDDSELEKGIKETEDTVQKSGNNIKGITKKTAVAVGASFIAAGATAIKFGSEFETEMTKTSTLFGDVAVDSQKLNDDILALSSSSGIAASELGGALYDALSAGIPVTEDMAESVAFLDKNTKLAKGGFTDINTAIDTTTSVINAYGMEVEDTDEIHKILMQTQNQGKTTVGELGAALSNVTPTAAAMGVSFDNVGASLSTMTAAGVPTAQATTKLNSLIAELGKEGTSASKALSEATENTELAGMSFTDMMDQGIPLNQVLDTMGDYADDNNMSMIDMFGSLEAGSAALLLSGDNSEAFTENLNAMGTEIDVVTEASDAMDDTFANRLNVAMETAKNIFINIFDAITPIIDIAMPVLIELLEFLAEALTTGIDLLTSFAEFLKKNEDIAVLLGIAVTTLTTAILAYIIGLKIHAIVTGISTIATNAFKISMDFLNTSMIGIILVIGLLIAIGYLLYKNWDTISEFFVKVWDWIKEKVSNIIESIKNVIVDTWEWIKNFIDNTLEKISDKFGFIFDGIKGNISNTFDSIKKIFGNIKGVFEGLIDFITGVFTGNWEKAWEGVKKIFGNVFDGLKNLAKIPINNIIGGINTFLKGINKIKIPDWVPGLKGKGFNIPLIPKLQKGGLAFGETLAMVGDNPNANTDPEVIAPFSMLENMLTSKLNVSANKNISVNASMVGIMEVDGFELGKIVYRNLDDINYFS